MIQRVRATGDRGAVIVEVAFVIPILFLLVLALCDFALAELSDAAGSNAAREGARVGILYYDGAHTVGTANNNKIIAAVSQKLAGNVKGTPTVTVRCLNADNTPRPSSGSCSAVGTDTIVPGEDLIEVTVQWTRKGGITGLVGSGFRTDKAVMRIVGTPPTGSSAPPATCSISASSATPSSVVRTGGSIPQIVFSVTVSNRASCGGVDLTFPAEAAYAGPQTMAEVSAGSTSFTFPLPAGQGSWTAGLKTVTASSNGGSVTQPISFTVNDPSVCVLSVTTPVTAQQSGGILTAPVTFNASVSDVIVCGTPTITFPAQAGYGGPQTMTSAGGTAFTFTLPAAQGSWSSQTYSVTVNGNGGVTRTISFTVSTAPVCTLSALDISPTSAPVKKTGQQEILVAVTFTVTRSSTTVCAIPTVTVTPGASGTSGSANDLTTAKAMTCSGLTCTYQVANGTRDWYPASGARTVAVTASGSTVSGTLTLT